jgi:dihydrofolate reductase
MRKMVAAAFVSLDGVMQAPGGPEEDPSGGFAHGGWTFPYFDQALGEAMDELFAEPFDLLLGRRTYDIFAAHWPHSGDAMGAMFTAVTKYVATHRPQTLSWLNSESLGGDPAARLREMKQEDGPKLLIQGSSDLIQTLLAEDLIDEFRLLIFPLVLGPGKRLFGRGALPAAFELTASRAFPTGVLQAVYERAGEVRTGSFALEEPSEAELARRQDQSR